MRGLVSSVMVWSGSFAVTCCSDAGDRALGLGFLVGGACIMLSGLIDDDAKLRAEKARAEK